jgi:integral membrane sensor domain MASE1
VIFTILPLLVFGNASAADFVRLVLLWFFGSATTATALQPFSLQLALELFPFHPFINLLPIVISSQD